jgi:hypothetical protein
MGTFTDLKLEPVVDDDPVLASADIVRRELALLASGHPMVNEEWAEVLMTLPVDLEETARQTKALQRRREIKQAVDLLRLVLAYCVCDWPLRLVGLWVTLKNIGYLSDVAIMRRLQKAKPWLEFLVGAMLKARQLDLTAAYPVRVRIVDGSSISIPGSQGTDYRLHLSLDLKSQRNDGVAVTDVHGAETLARFPSRLGDIWLADRGYALCPGVGAVLETQGDVVVRIGWATFPMEKREGMAFDLFAWLRQMPIAEPSEHPVSICTPQGRFFLRLIAQRLPQEAAEKNRRRMRTRASRKGRTPDRRTLEAAGYIFLVTSLPTEVWTAVHVLALYRLRWQVELIFKRLKSILDLDHLRAKGPILAQTYLLGKILAALIIEAMADQVAQRHPALFTDTQRPVSAWRWTSIGRDFLYHAVRGHVSWRTFLDKVATLSRYLCVSPRRKRQNQAMAARTMLDRLLGPQVVAPPTLS